MLYPIWILQLLYDDKFSFNFNFIQNIIEFIRKLYYSSFSYRIISYSYRITNNKILCILDIFDDIKFNKLIHKTFDNYS